MQHNKKLTKQAQNLRRNMTKEERRLWYEYLREYPHSFRRQVTCGRFILDFYCAAARLAIELDGTQHYLEKGKQSDEKRDAWLMENGIRVLRFSNLDVLKNLPGVCQQIDKVVAERIMAVR